MFLRGIDLKIHLVAAHHMFERRSSSVDHMRDAESFIII